MIVTQLLLLAAVAGQGPSVIHQTTTGWCSPIITNVTGNVRVNCIGVDPRALKRLNLELNRTNKELTAKIDEANDWAERYHELETRLNEPGPNEELAQQAENALHEGELEKAKEILDRILEQDEKEESRIAAHNYNRGLIAQLEFKPLEALPYFDKAYRFRPANPEYGGNYGRVLLQQHQYALAEPVLMDVLKRIRLLALKDPQKHSRELARILHNKGTLEAETSRFPDAEKDFNEELKVTRELAKTDASEFNVFVSRALTSLGDLYANTLRYDPSERAFKEAIVLQRGLPESPLNRDILAQSLHSYSVLLGKMDRDDEAFAAMKECVSIRRELAMANPAAYDPDFASSLQTFADDLRGAKHLQEAETAAREAVAIQTRLAAANPDAYRSTLANALGILGNIYGDAQRHEEAQAAYRQSVDIFRELATAAPSAFEPDLAVSLANLGSEYFNAGKRKEGEASLREALDLEVRLSQLSLEAFGQRVVESASILAGMFILAKDFDRAEPFFLQASDMARRLASLKSTYRPLLAQQLQALALIYIQSSQWDKVAPVLDEATKTHKELFAADPAHFGDLLATDYFLSSQWLETKDPAQACKFVGQAADVARNPEMKQGFKTELEDCRKNADDPHPR